MSVLFSVVFPTPFWSWLCGVLVCPFAQWEQEISFLYQEEEMRGHPHSLDLPARGGSAHFYFSKVVKLEIGSEMARQVSGT